MKLFFPPADSHTKGLLVLLHRGLEGITEVDTDLKGGFVSVFMPLQGIAPGNSWLRGVSLKDYKIIWKIKMREMKTK